MATCLLLNRSAQLVSRFRKPTAGCARAVLIEQQHGFRMSSTAPSAELRGGEQLVLGIESSCDDTGVALLRASDGNILGETVVGQTAVHAQWGGVVPTLAMEAHKRAIDKAVEEVLQQAGLPLNRITACAATIGPGLSMCLQVGARKAMSLAQQQGIPFVPVHHMEAHALTVRQGKAVEFPYLCLLVSGGHSMLLIVHGVGDYTLLGTSLDDSVGEAFDKTARMLGLPLEPSGGAAVESFAQGGDPQACRFAVPLARREDCNFSYAGIKTAVLLAVQRLPGDLDEAALRQAKQDIAASFQRVAVQHLADKTARAARWATAEHPSIRTLVIAGGVACNQLVKQRLGNLAQTAGLELVAPPPRLCTDNGVMVAWAGIERLRLGLCESVALDQDIERVDVWPRWPLTNRTDERFLPERRSAKKSGIHTSLTEITMAQLAAAHSSTEALGAYA